MRIHCVVVPRLIRQRMLTGQVAVVIDVLRASTVIVRAIDSGCSWLYPVRTRKEALETCKHVEGGQLLLVGERQGVKLKGFDMGNSPLEYTPENVRGHRLIMTTTNGTNAVHRSNSARKVIIGSFSNLSAVVATIKKAEEIVLVCAGTRGQLSLEDTACAGAIVERIVREGDAACTDAAKIARYVYLQHKDDLAGMMKTHSEHGKKLIRLGFKDDISYAAKIDISSSVPVLHMPARMIKPLSSTAHR